MLNKILVAIDESAASQRALASAIEFASALKAELVLVHALDVFAPSSPERPSLSFNSYSMALEKAVQETYQSEWNQFVNHYDALLKQKKEKAKAVGIKASYEQPYGRPGPAICEVARSHKVDLIMIGSRNHTYLKELVLGSVSNYIIHHAPCSVTVIHSVPPQETSLAKRAELASIGQA
ncbi:universal stress protein family, putative [Synechococcus sp. PCC 7335]|uniref:universal stress protein n=1 Tax=Synechococcus sp. (strain ATCC 29403 / PCC 7335) TaxID=91464 RepID=UPI00017ED64C|nr:universal stress protein [Synechococcus sp. PCC 7335]EDX82889.1 universal stress protein family, putative [Synechococcus sp. PCC 7335]